METEERTQSWGIWYLVGGAVVGAVAGLLFAPKAGEETRDELDKWARRNRSRAQGWLASIGNAIPSRVKAAAAYGAAKHGADEAFEMSKDTVKSSVGSR